MVLEDSVYIYGVCRCHPGEITLPLGLEGEIHLVGVDELAAIVEYGIDLEALQADDQRLLTAVLSHDRVICDLFQQTTILPIRFGTQLASRDKLQQHMASQYEFYQTRLTELTHKFEYQIKLTPRSITLSPPPEGLKGRDYFLAKKQRLQDQVTAQDQQQKELIELLTGIQQVFPAAVNATSEDGIVKVYVLLDSHESQTLQQQAEQWQAAAAAWQLSLSEALPPYHFVG